jgi:uncharacterized protein YjiS (DUF1127 family)
MKLSQKVNTSQSDRQREIDSFNRKIQRQRVGFGLLTPGFGLAPDGINFSHGNRPQKSRAGLDTSSCKVPAANRSRLVRNAVRKAAIVVSQSWQAMHTRQQQRKTIYNLLSSPDHYLDDIGLDRAELELLLYTNESLEQLIRARRDEKDREASHGASIVAAANSADNRGYTGIGLDRAA